MLPCLYLLLRRVKRSEIMNHMEFIYDHDGDEK